MHRLNVLLAFFVGATIIGAALNSPEHGLNAAKSPKRVASSSTAQGEIVFVRGDKAGAAICTMKPDGSAIVSVLKKRVSLYSPQWNRQRSRIIYSSNQDSRRRSSLRNVTFDIYSMNRNGAQTKRLTKWPGLALGPSYAPNGKKIVFMAMKRVGGDKLSASHIYTMNADGSGIKQLTHGGENKNPAFTPDGKAIVFMRAFGRNQEICRMNANGTGQKRLTNSPGTDQTPAVSPDGAKIAWVSRRDGSYQIYSMNVDGSRQKRLTQGRAPNSGPSFSPDGKRIVFSSRRDGNHELYTMSRDGKDVKRLTKTSTDEFYPCWR